MIINIIKIIANLIISNKVDIINHREKIRMKEKINPKKDSKMIEMKIELGSINNTMIDGITIKMIEMTNNIMVVKKKIITNAIIKIKGNSIKKNKNTKIKI